MSTHTCGPCGATFQEETAYLAHQCSKAQGAMPTDPQYLIQTTTPDFAQISQSAQERGAAKLEGVS
jgi:hypothetical protein